MKAIVVFVVAAAFAICIAVFKIDCDTCSGAGRLEGVKTVQVSCVSCRGTGKVKGSQSGSLSGKVDKAMGDGLRQCFKCKGRGYSEKNVPAGACSDCDGAGKIKLYKRFTGRN